MNRSAEREAMRRLRRGDPAARKLYDEWLMLDALGLVGDDGLVTCPECGEEVDRADGWYMRFECGCGWQLCDEEVAPW